MQTTRSRKRTPPQPVTGSARWVGGAPTQGRLDDGDACLQITVAGKEPSFYFVETHKDNEKVVGYRLTKIDALEKAASYDVEATPRGLRCDCPDATYCDRPHGCKHIRGLSAALKAAGLN